MCGVNVRSAIRSDLPSSPKPRQTAPAGALLTYYRWRKEFGGLKTDQVKRLQEIEKVNERLRKAVSDLTI